MLHLLPCLREPGIEHFLLGDFHAVATEEHGSHGIQQIFVILQIFFIFDQVQLELLPHALVQESLVVFDIVNELSEQIVRFNGVLHQVTLILISGRTMEQRAQLIQLILQKRLSVELMLRSV